MALPAFVKVLGHTKPVDETLIAFNSPPKSSLHSPIIKFASKMEEKHPDDEEDVDLFGDDDDGEAAQKAAAAAKASKKKKEKPAEMSLIMVEIKPVDDTTDLDTLA